MMAPAEYADVDELRYDFNDMDDDVMERREQDEGRAGRAPDKAGAYPGIIQSMKARTKNASGNPTKDIEVIGEINDGQFSGWRGRIYINVDPDGDYFDLNREIYYQTLNAVGLADRNKRKGKFKISDAEGRACTLIVTLEADNRPERAGQMQARLNRILKPGLSSATSGAQTAAEPAETGGGSEDLPF